MRKIKHMDFCRMNTKEDKLLTKDQLAEKMCVKRRTIDNWMKVGWLPYLKIGKTVRFEFSSVMEKLKSYELGGER
jgi:excisionase family DNA binding protein